MTILSVGITFLQGGSNSRPTVCVFQENKWPNSRLVIAKRSARCSAFISLPSGTFRGFASQCCLLVLAADRDRPAPPGHAPCGRAAQRRRIHTQHTVQRVINQR